MITQFCSGRSKDLLKEHFLTTLTNGALGECLITQRKYAETEPLFLKESLKISQSAENLQTETVRQQIVSLYKSLGKTDLANAYRKKIL